MRCSVETPAMRFVKLIHETISHGSDVTPGSPALTFKASTLSYRDLWLEVQRVAQGFGRLGLEPGGRVGVFLPKRLETVIALYAAAAAGGVFVPINPLLKPAQVAFILRDCNVRILVTSDDRASLLAAELAHCPDLRHVVVVDEQAGGARSTVVPEVGWDAIQAAGASAPGPVRRIDADMAAILYTSGSSGHPKGVVLSHRNLVAAAQSAAESLDNTEADRILAVLPLSFDAGLVQVTSALTVGGSVVLMEYLLPNDVIKAVVRHAVTGLAAVPALWAKLSALRWPDEARRSLRYITNSGGAMPLTVLRALRAQLPQTEIVLNYGLTEAFRSTCLRGDQVDVRPDSVGKALPNVEIMVVREDGTPCAPGEPGELVHRGALVALGYWNDREKTAERFRPVPGHPAGIPTPELAVWSGDQVRLDEEGYLYFISRKDEMIKTSGYRVSPTEVEEVAYASGLVAEAAAIGVPHPSIEKGIVVVVVPKEPADAGGLEARLGEHFRQALPAFMVPHRVVVTGSLELSPNGKIDRRALATRFQDLLKDQEIR